MKRTTLIVLGWLGLSLTAHAASFDCAKASTKVEKLICGDAALSKLDVELNAAYKTALQDEKQADTVKQAQKQWVKERNGCEDAACVKGAYEARLLSLAGTHTSTDGGVAEKPVSAMPPVQAKADEPTKPRVEEACLAPKIDWRNYEWTLITGNGLPVCEEMLAYVKSRPKDVAPPTCPEERLPQNGNWSRPDIRILSEEEKQVILHDIPELWRHKPSGVSYERQIKESVLLRVIRGDITRDGTPESFLALGGFADLQKTCERSTRCAVSNEVFKEANKNQIHLSSDSYDLLPMNDAGTQIDWEHRIRIQTTGGELMYYKGLPYWLSRDVWGQASHDDFVHSSMRPNDPYSAIFSLAEIGVGPVINGNKTPHFKDVTVIATEHDSESNRVCRFGYFHRDNLKQNPPKIRR